MTMPHLMNCPHKGGTWCLKCVGEEWDRREAERDAMSARIAELERKAKAFDAIDNGDVEIELGNHADPDDDDVSYRWAVFLADGRDVDGVANDDLLTAVEAAIAAKETK